MTVDYIQWELLRQREQLRRLLSGGPAENPERESLQENAVPRTEMAADAVSPGKAAEEAARLRTAPADGGGDGTEAGAGPAADRSGTRRRAGTVSGIVSGTQAAGSGTAPDGWGGVSGGGVLAVLPGGETPAEALASARTVSRCAERDARRYDGGYPLY